MEVKLLHYTPLDICDIAVGKCWGTGPKSTPEERDARLKRVILKHKHGSIAEHVSYTYDIDGISRACLQELARHRHASLSVKSTRYTLKELKSGGNPLDYLVMVQNPSVNEANILQLGKVKEALEQGFSNDTVKYMLPEAYKTSLVWTINMRSLQNFLNLRTDKSALWEIQVLAQKIYKALPISHKFMLDEFVKGTRL